MNDYYLEKSNRKDKKYMVHYINKDTGNINTIHFGAKGMNDYTITGDDEAKKRYILRHKKNEDWANIWKSGTWSRFLLWNLKSINASIKDMEKKFDIKIHLI